MKRKVSIALALMLVLCMICSLFAFVGCDDECTRHVDADGDGKCDNCGADMPKEPCTEHVDANNDGKCDVCGADMSTDPEPTPDPDEHEHVDTNDDGKCDVCGLCLNHRDTNGDGKCDNCDQCMEHRDANKDGKCDNCGKSVISTYAPDNAVKKIVENLTAQYSALAGSYVFGINFDVTLDRKTSDLDEDYVLRGKASIDLTAANAADKDSALWIELVKKVDGGEETIFGVAMEMTNGEPYMYANIMGENYVKINAVSIYDLAALAGKTEPLASSLATADGGLDMGEIIESAIYSIIFDGFVEHNVVENTYALEVNIGNTVYQLANLLQIFDLGSLIGISDADIVAVINEIFGQLSYTEDETTVNVEDLSDLLMWVNSKYGNYGGAALVTFDKDNKLVDVTASFNDGESDSIALDLGTLEIGVSEVAVMDTFPMSEAERIAAEAINLLNFHIEGTATLEDADGQAFKYYTAKIDIDLDPFALLKLINGTSTENIVAAIKELGSISIMVDEVNADGTRLQENVIVIYSELETGNVVAQIMGGKAKVSFLTAEIELGGLYNIDDLLGLIDLMNCKHVDADKDDVCDICHDDEVHVSDTDNDGKCDVCGACIEHKDANDDGKCDNCEACVEHVDKNNDGKCDNCEACMGHVDANEDKKCDVCGACIEHVDTNSDCVCDECGGAAHVDADGSGRCDKCDYLMSGGFDIVKLVKALMPTLGTENMKENGVDIKIGDTVNAVLGALGLESLTDQIKLEGVWFNAANINIKAQTPAYGEANIVGYANVYPSFSYDMVKEFDKVTIGDYDFAVGADAAATVVDKNYPFELIEGSALKAYIDGKNFKDQPVTDVVGAVTSYTGYDPDLYGVEQTITLYMAILNKEGSAGIIGLLTNPLLSGIIESFVPGGIDPKLPLLGLQKIEIKIIVQDTDEDAVVTSNAKQDVEMPTQENLFTALFAGNAEYKVVANGQEHTASVAQRSWKVAAVLDKTGKDVTEDVLTGTSGSNYKITVPGTYTIRTIVAGEYYSEATVDVILVQTKLSEETAESITLGSEFNLGATLVKTVGESDTTLATLGTETEGVTWKFVVDGEELELGKEIVKNENDTYTLAKKLDYLGKTLTVSAVYDGVEYAAKAIAIAKDESAPTYKAGTDPKFLQSVNDVYSFTIGDKEYSIAWNGTAFEAKDKDDTAFDGTLDVKMTLSYTNSKGDQSGIAATFDENGVITNINNDIAEAGSSGATTTVNVTLSVNGWEYTDSFVQRTIYGTNSTSTTLNKVNKKTVQSSISATYVYWTNESGTSVSLNQKSYDAEKKAVMFGYKQDDVITNVITVNVKVVDRSTKEEITLNADGTFAKAGEYDVTFTYTIGEVTYNGMMQINIGE